MGVQNSYNSYIKRQKQNSTGQFRQKVMNSLGGVSTGNNTTKKPQGVLGQPTSTSTLGTGVTPSPMKTPTTPITTPPQSPSAPHSINQGIFTPGSSRNALEPNITPQSTTSSPQQPTTPASVTPTNIPVDVPTEGMGMMSLEDINNTFETDDNSDQEVPLTEGDYYAISNLAKTPEIQSMARATTKNNKTKAKTPEEIAKEIFEQEKKQAIKDKELREKEALIREQQLKQSFNQSKIDADNAYKQSQEDLQDSRYQQQEDLAVSGQRRGIQYSPQQLALENVANINYNKNLSQLSVKRNELLNKLTIELNNALADVELGRLNSINEYDKNVTQYMSDYNKQLMDMAYNDRTAQEDRAFQEKMQKDQNKWQSKENALDRKKSSRSYSGGGYSYSGGGGSYYSPGGGYSSSYTPNTLNMNDDLDANTLLQTGREGLTDMYNYISDIGGMDELENKGGAYNEFYKNVINQLDNVKGSSKVKSELDKAYDTGLKHLYNKSYAYSTNTPYLNRGVKITPNKTTNLRTIHENKKYKDMFEAEYYSKYARDKKDRQEWDKKASNARKTANDRRTKNYNKDKSKNTSKIQNSFAYKAKSGTLNSTKKKTTKKKTDIRNSFAYKSKAGINNTSKKKTTPKKKTNIQNSFAYKAKTGTLPKKKKSNSNFMSKVKNFFKW